MKITLYCVGRLRQGPEAALFQDYQERLQQAQRLGPLLVREVEAKKRGSGADVSTEEAKALLAALPKKSASVRFLVLDERGKNFSSPAFALLLGGWQDEGAREVAAIIGGAGGLTEEIRALGDATLALGTMTWPHLLVRCLLAEQIYRAETILTNHPYHRG